MSIFDAITGSASKKAAKQNTLAINQAIGAGTSALNTGAAKATGYLGVDNGGNALQALGQGYGQARNDLTSQYGTTQGFLGQLGSQYAPMVEQGSRAYGAYNDAIGANGVEGAARATANFQAAPGYEYARDQALEGVMRTAAARGGLAGGNATADILRTATGLADQGYQQYISNLKGGSDFYTTGLAGQGQGLSAQAQASQNQGTALGNLGTGLGQGQANIFGQGAGVQTGLGQNLANLQLGGAQALVGNNNQLAASQNQASANFLNLGSNLLGGVGNFVSGGGLTRLGNLFA